MKKWIFLVLFIFILNVGNVFAGSVKEIRLADDSVIYGEIVGIQYGEYKIKTENMGTIEIAEEKVVSIKSKPSSEGVTAQDIEKLQVVSPNPVEPQAVNAGIEALKRNFQNDSTIMQSISNLQYDPAFVAALNDPEIMSAVNSGDVNALTSNPKFMELLNHPTVRGISGRVE